MRKTYLLVLFGCFLALYDLILDAWFSIREGRMLPWEGIEKKTRSPWSVIFLANSKWTFLLATPNQELCSNRDIRTAHGVKFPASYLRESRWVLDLTNVFFKTKKLKGAVTKCIMFLATSLWWPFLHARPNQRLYSNGDTWTADDTQSAVCWSEEIMCVLEQDFVSYVWCLKRKKIYKPTKKHMWSS
jgi:hypothetical protein